MAGRLRLPSRPRGPRDEMRMTLIEHLDELRSRIIKVGVAFFGVAIVAWFFRERIFDWLLAPAGGCPARQAERYLGHRAAVHRHEAGARTSAFVLTIPMLLYQMWAFVAPAVGRHGQGLHVHHNQPGLRAVHRRGSSSGTSSCCPSAPSSCSTGTRTGTTPSLPPRATWLS